MVYIPNPLDPTQPTDGVFAETAQAEFRAIKNVAAQRLFKNVAPTIFSNNSGSITLQACTIPAGTLNASRSVKSETKGRWFNGTAAAFNMTWDIFYGTQKDAGATISLPIGANYGLWEVDVDLWNIGGSTNQQLVKVEVTLWNVSNNTSPATAIAQQASIFPNSTVDSTVDQLLQVFGHMAVADPNANIITDYSSVIVI